ncbi:hypothetical protein D081_1811 [Anaerovibrio sp. JC8]|uniref:hypothetical protein n=1 Tax=Anaerovibrio sp. JC8 TaxID=1240085 RepID=UPI000A0E9550|nr:hypothetical protein [Anaerovibrio sp. JC8]ORT99661.1 hypothetical protein D081_1811 [Anaerovibrio sp. JC8]
MHILEVLKKMDEITTAIIDTESEEKNILYSDQLQDIYQDLQAFYPQMVANAAEYKLISDFLAYDLIDVDEIDIDIYMFGGRLLELILAFEGVQ